MLMFQVCGKITVYKLLAVLTVIVFVTVIEYQTMVRVEQIRWVNALVEITIALLGAYLFVWKKPVINKKIIKALDVGFFLFFLSMMIDSLDQFFIHSELYTAVFEKCTLLVGVYFIIYGIGKWFVLNQDLNNKLVNKTITDELTQLLNRRGIMNHLSNLKEHNPPKSYSFIVMDIDDFKVVNDRFGHFVGDRTLQMIGSFFKAKALDNWAIGRWGGEEFIIVLSDTSIQEAKQIAESIRKSVQDIKPVREKDEFRITLSIGVSVYSEQDHSYLAAVCRADKLLYQAKSLGKNKVISELDLTDVNCCS